MQAGLAHQWNAGGIELLGSDVLALDRITRRCELEASPGVCEEAGDLVNAFAF